MPVIQQPMKSMQALHHNMIGEFRHETDPDTDPEPDTKMVASAPE